MMAEAKRPFFDQFIANTVFQEHTADVIQLIFKKKLSRRTIFNGKCELRSIVDVITRDLIFELDAYILGMPKERLRIFERWPEDWWQAFKERWFPRWLLKRYPVKYRTIDIDRTLYERVCPHLKIEPKSAHFHWLARGEPKVPKDRS